MAPAHDQLPGHGDEVREKGAGAPGNDQRPKGPQHRVSDATIGYQHSQCASNPIYKDADSMELFLKLC